MIGSARTVTIMNRMTCSYTPGGNVRSRTDWPILPSSSPNGLGPPWRVSSYSVIWVSRDQCLRSGTSSPTRARMSMVKVKKIGRVTKTKEDNSLVASDNHRQARATRAAQRYTILPCKKVRVRSPRCPWRFLGARLGAAPARKRLIPSRSLPRQRRLHLPAWLWSNRRTAGPVVEALCLRIVLPTLLKKRNLKNRTTFCIPTYA